MIVSSIGLVHLQVQLGYALSAGDPRMPRAYNVSRRCISGSAGSFFACGLCQPPQALTGNGSLECVRKSVKRFSGKDAR